MSALLNSCDDCAELVLSECEDIEISAGLDPDTDYYWTITDNFGNKWGHTDTTDGDGTLILLSSYFPDGFLSIGIGQLSLEIKTSVNGDVVPVTFDGYTDYDCILITFQSAQSILCTQAAATVTFDSLPADGDTFAINFPLGDGDVVFTFLLTPTTPEHIQLADNISDQAQNFYDTISAWLLANNPAVKLSHSGLQETFTATEGGEYDCSVGNELVINWANAMFVETSPKTFTGGTG